MATKQEHKYYKEQKLTPSFWAEGLRKLVCGLPILRNLAEMQVWGDKGRDKWVRDEYQVFNKPSNKLPFTIHQLDCDPNITHQFC